MLPCEEAGLCCWYVPPCAVPTMCLKYVLLKTMCLYMASCADSMCCHNHVPEVCAAKAMCHMGGDAQSLVLPLSLPPSLLSSLSLPPSHDYDSDFSAFFTKNYPCTHPCNMDEVKEFFCCYGSNTNTNTYLGSDHHSCQHYN